MSERDNTASGGVGTLGLLGILFVGLKLGHVIDWPWIWVTAPFWGAAAFFVVLILIAVVIAITSVVVKALLGGK